jgi:nitrate reductase gamma subunit
MKFKTARLFQKRRIARRRIRTTEKGVQALIIILALVVFLLVGCSYRMVPNETKIEYGTTETDAKNSKLQEKKFITQTWKWR